jgi:hypothetical protein
MGLLNLLVLKKVNDDQTAKAKESPTHVPPIPPFIIPGAAAQALLPALLVYKFDIPNRHLLFCMLYPAYLIFANHFRFGNNIAIRKRSTHHPSNLSVAMSKIYSEYDTTWFKCYMAFVTIVGGLLPLMTVSLAPTEVADAAISPLFVWWTQIICATVAMLNPYVHRYIAFLVPMGFFVYRESLLLDWFSASLTSYYANETPSQWYTFGLILSSVNLIIWTVSLFVFVLLRCAPEFLADEKCESPEIEWKMMVPQIKPSGLKKKSSSVGDEKNKKIVPAKAA